MTLPSGHGAASKHSEPGTDRRVALSGQKLLPQEKAVLESNQAMSLLTIMEIIGPVLLIAALIYGTVQWSRRRRGPAQAAGEAATRQLYREGAKAEERKAAMPSPPSGGTGGVRG
jgi:hypothetical protein